MSVRILIADDEELERRALKHILGTIEEETIEVIEASNGRQAVAAAREAQPDLALLDIRMPGIDGIEAAKELREASPATRCVFLTAFESFDYAREAIRLGAQEYLLKPAEPEAVKRAVLDAIGRMRRERLEDERRRKAGDDGEKALSLLEAELKRSLDRGSLDGARLHSYLSLRGVPEGDRFVLVIRPLPGLRSSPESRLAATRRLEAIARSVLLEAGWVTLTGCDETEVRAAAACVLERTPAGPLPASVKALLSAIESRSRSDLGARILVGAAPSFASDGPELFSAAQDALALASVLHPIVVLEPQSRETSADRSRGLSSGGPVVERAIEHLRSRIAEDLSLADVAAAVSCSPFHLSRLFSLHAGDTFVHVFARLRVEAAKSLLRTGEYSVKEVGAMVGFRDQTYFARVFRRFEGRTPAAFAAEESGSGGAR